VFGGSATEQDWLARGAPCIQQIARSEKIERVTDAVSADATTALAGETTLLVPLMDLIDPAVEAERLTKELGRLEQDLARVEGKLANESFVSRAPADVVDKERKRAADNADQIARLKAQLQKLTG
jgi:valyl-tRNA synthetase